MRIISGCHLREKKRLGLPPCRPCYSGLLRMPGAPGGAVGGAAPDTAQFPAPLPSFTQETVGAPLPCSSFTLRGAGDNDSSLGSTKWKFLTAPTESVDSSCPGSGWAWPQPRRCAHSSWRRAGAPKFIMRTAGHSVQVQG